MHSHPFLVIFFQISEFNLSLGVLEPCYTLGIMNHLHVDFVGKVIEDLRVELLCQPYLILLSSLESLKTLRILNFGRKI